MGTRCRNNPVLFLHMTQRSENPSLAGQVVLITGGARRVGAEVARTLHAAGANVLIHYRASEAAAVALADEFNRCRPHSAAMHAANLAYAEAPEGLVAAALEEFGRLDILINNASSFYATPVGKITIPMWDDLMASNLRAPLFLSQSSTWSTSMACGLSKATPSTAPPRRGLPC
jgi:pteridine reductase